MDHDLYRFDPIVHRTSRFLGAGTRLAVYVVLHLEYQELIAPPGSRRDPRFAGEFGDFLPPFRSWSAREYGNRVGIFRLLEVFDELRLPVSVAVNGTAAQRYPQLVAACRERGMEPIAHGLASSRMLHSRMSEQQEKEHIARAADLLERNWGTRALGWLGQDFGGSARTPHLLASAGFDYVLDWANDELPYWQCDGRLVALPSFPDWDDVEQLHLRRLGAWRYPGLVADAATTLAGGEQPRLFGLGMHPWVAGQPHHIRYVREALARLRAMEGVAFMHCGEMVRRFRAAEEKAVA